MKINNREVSTEEAGVIINDLLDFIYNTYDAMTDDYKEESMGILDKHGINRWDKNQRRI